MKKRQIKTFLSLLFAVIVTSSCGNPTQQNTTQSTAITTVTEETTTEEVFSQVFDSDLLESRGMKINDDNVFAIYDDINAGSSMIEFGIELAEDTSELRFVLSDKEKWLDLNELVIETGQTCDELGINWVHYAYDSADFSYVAIDSLYKRHDAAYEDLGSGRAVCIKLQNVFRAHMG